MDLILEKERASELQKQFYDLCQHDNLDGVRYLLTHNNAAHLYLISNPSFNVSYPLEELLIDAALERPTNSLNILIWALDELNIHASQCYFYLFDQFKESPSDTRKDEICHLLLSRYAPPSVQAIAPIGPYRRSYDAKHLTYQATQMWKPYERAIADEKLGTTLRLYKAGAWEDFCSYTSRLDVRFALASYGPIDFPDKYGRFEVMLIKHMFPSNLDHTAATRFQDQLRILQYSVDVIGIKLQWTMPNLIQYSNAVMLPDGRDESLLELTLQQIIKVGKFLLERISHWDPQNTCRLHEWNRATVEGLNVLPAFEPEFTADLLNATQRNSAFQDLALRYSPTRNRQYKYLLYTRFLANMSDDQLKALHPLMRGTAVDASIQFVLRQRHHKRTALLMQSAFAKGPSDTDTNLHIIHQDGIEHIADKVSPDIKSYFSWAKKVLKTDFTP